MNRLVKLIRPEQVREFSLVISIVLAVLFFGTQIENYYTYLDQCRRDSGDGGGANAGGADAQY
jgi:hypothetical protein